MKRKTKFAPWNKTGSCNISVQWLNKKFWAFYIWQQKYSYCETELAWGEQLGRLGFLLDFWRWWGWGWWGWARRTSLGSNLWGPLALWAQGNLVLAPPKDFVRILVGQLRFRETAIKTSVLAVDLKYITTSPSKVKDFSLNNPQCVHVLRLPTSGSKMWSLVLYTFYGIHKFPTAIQSFEVGGMSLK